MTVINFIGWSQCFSILPYSELEMYVSCSNTMKLYIYRTAVLVRIKLIVSRQVLIVQPLMQSTSLTHNLTRSAFLSS